MSTISARNAYRAGQIYFSRDDSRRVVLVDTLKVEIPSGFSDRWEVELYERGEYVGLASYTAGQLDKSFPVKLGL
jgi:hypothetical protein